MSQYFGSKQAKKKTWEKSPLYVCVTPTPVSRVSLETQHLPHDGLNKVTNFKLSILNKFFCFHVCAKIEIDVLLFSSFHFGDD